MSGLFKPFQAGMLSLTAAIISTVWLATPSVVAAQDTGLSRAISNCWHSVDEGGLASLSGYGMAFMRVEKAGKSAENEIWRGLVRTELGDIEIRAQLRDQVIFECTLQTLLASDESNSISYEEATKTLQSWYGEKLHREGYFETLSDTRFFGLVRCVPDKPVISSSAMSFGLFDPAIVAINRKEPIPGSLMLTVFRTSPENFEFCANSGTL